MWSVAVGGVSIVLSTEGWSAVSVCTEGSEPGSEPAKTVSVDTIGKLEEALHGWRKLGLLDGVRRCRHVECERPAGRTGGKPYDQQHPVCRDWCGYHCPGGEHAVDTKWMAHVLHVIDCGGDGDCGGEG